MVKTYDSVPTIGHGVEVRESQISNAGKGLFTKQHFRRGSLITEYYGPILSHEAAKQLRIRRQHSHIRVLNIQFLYIDGIRDPQDGVGGASFANDGRGFIPNNATFETIYDSTKARDRVFLKALCDLPPDTEVLVSYGTTYWNQHGCESQECSRNSATQQLQFSPEDLGASEPQQHLLLHQAAGTAQLPGASAAQQVPQQRRQRRRPWQDVSSTEPFDGPDMQQQHQQRKRRRPAQRQRQDAVTAEMLADSGVRQQHLQHADQADLSEDFGQQQQQQGQGSDAADLSDDLGQQQQQKPPSARAIRKRLSAAQSYATRKQQAQELEAKHAELLFEHQALQQALAEMEVEVQLHRSIAIGAIGACPSAAAAMAGSAAVAGAPAARLYQAEAAVPALAAAHSSGLAQRARADVQQQQQEVKELQQQHEQQHQQKQDMKHAAKDPAPSAAAAAVPGSSSPHSSCDGSQRPAAMPHSHMLEPGPPPQQQQQSAWVVEDATALIAATLEAAAVVTAMPIAQESDIRADTAAVAVTGTSIRQTAAAQADAAAVARQGAEAGVAATATGKLICAFTAAADNKKAKPRAASRCRNK